MPSTETALMTVEEFQALPRPVGPVDYELHDGVLVPVTRPKSKHIFLQHQLRDLLKALAPTGSFVGIEVPFRTTPEYNLRVADVAYLSPNRWAAVDPEDNIYGAPDLVVEVLSPSNTASEMLEREQSCLEHGSSEFWVVDPDRKRIRVTTAAGQVHTYGPGQSIPVPMLGAELPVDTIFA